jgi:hypothetical protein
MQKIFMFCADWPMPLSHFSQRRCAKFLVTCEGYYIFQSTQYVITTMVQQNFCTCYFTFLSSLNIKIIYYNSKEMFPSSLLACSSHFAHKHISICRCVCMHNLPSCMNCLDAASKNIVLWNFNFISTISNPFTPLARWSMFFFLKYAVYLKISLPPFQQI